MRGCLVGRSCCTGPVRLAHCTACRLAIPPEPTTPPGLRDSRNVERTWRSSSEPGPTTCNSNAVVGPLDTTGRTTPPPPPPGIGECLRRVADKER
uniref:Secreted protein n=1 Tax=Knipowitschia caucasica TaxID=637954 RepID=A0AAV2MU11_KNICA